jgi:hypothetical protein
VSSSSARAVLSALALVLGVTGAIAAVSGRAASREQAGPALRGPATVVPGRIVRFRATGFRPGSNVEVVLAPADRATCCSVRVPASFRVAPDGSAALRFGMPVTYRRCPTWGACASIKWRVRQKVIVTATGYLAQAVATTTIGSR